MKFTIPSILMIFYILNLVSAGKFKNSTQKKKYSKKSINKTLNHKDTNNNDNNNNNNFSHISIHNSKLLEKFHLINSKNYSRIKQDFSDSFVNRLSYTGICMFKYKSHIINFYPLSESIENSNLFIKVENTLYDFDFCKDVYTHSGRKGLFVNKYKDVLYAGEKMEEKYFYIDEKAEDDDFIEEQPNRKNLNGIADRNTIINTKKQTSSKLADKHEFHRIANITVFLPKGDKCTSNKEYPFIIAYKFICDPKSDKPVLANPDKFNPESCFNVIEIKTDVICNRKTETFLIWYVKLGINKYLIGVAFLIFGSFLAFVSDIYREKSFIFTIGISIVYVVIFYIANLNFVYLLGTVAGVSFILLLLHDKKDLLVNIACAIMTMNFGIYIFTNTARSVMDNSEIKIDHYKALIYFICVVTIFTVGSMLEENLFFALLFTTSVGSLLFIRGISIFFGGYPDEKFTYLLLYYKEYAQYDRLFQKSKNIYAICYIALWISSMLFQYYLLVPIIHKLREYDREQKQNLLILNKLAEKLDKKEENHDGDLPLSEDKDKDKKLDADEKK